MAERERLTNKERRAQAREARKRAEAEAASKRKRSRLRNGLVTFAIVGVIAAVLIQAFLGGPETIDETVLLSSSEVIDAQEAAGCDVLRARSPLPERYHFEPNQAPHPDTLYTDVRPTHSGPHTVGIHPITASSDRQISETASTHNLEHGSVIVWYDPEQVDGSTADAIGEWATTLNANGFRRDTGGAGILSAPYEDPGISSGKAIAFRAWGTAIDCDIWDETVAMGFVATNFGNRGVAPERNFAPYPDDVLDFADEPASDTGDVTDADDGADAS
ncbi:MAG: DUF3105 domain-containing protein [Nitriliruptoraceae bacterium]